MNRMNKETSQKHILFITGTRADYGKIKSLLYAVKEKYKLTIFVTGMHMLSQYGSTYNALIKDGFRDNIYTYINQHGATTTEEALASTIHGLSLYCKEHKPDMIVVHGDRPETLAGAIVGAFNNILVAHIEGGDCTGTIDESIRHAVSKFAHIHCVVDEDAKKRLQSMGEDSNNIYVIGSPDLDLLYSSSLPSLSATKEHYAIPFETYAIALFHPVTTEERYAYEHAHQFVNALLESKDNYIVIAPNNDLGSAFIFQEYQRLENNHRIAYFPSLAFEHFLTLLRNAQYIIGNSSAGIRESRYYGIYTINIGTRQQGRYDMNLLPPDTHILSVPQCKKEDILTAIHTIPTLPQQSSHSLENHNSTRHFMDIIEKDETWNISIQKQWCVYDW